MKNGFSLILVVMAFLAYLEKIYPHYKLDKVKGWYPRAIVFNSVQLLISVVGHYTWDKYLIGHNIFELNMSPFWAGLFAYFIATWIFYWWHRFRHENKKLWLLIHQFHHSATRIEIITSLYKHPLEIFFNSIIMTILSYPILGLSLEANIWMDIWLAMGEFFYHLNMRTPRWIGYFIQRPESHRLHHLRNMRKCKNYGDLPLWDMLGGTFENPPSDAFHPTGFSEGAEQKIQEMLFAKDVMPKPIKGVKNKNNKNNKFTLAVAFLLGLGCLHIVGYAIGSATIKGIAFSTAASPLPLVFSAYNGIETFSTSFELNATLYNNTNVIMELNNKNYGNMQGPYNRRNVYGAIFCYGPFFNTTETKALRQMILTYGMCNNGSLAKEFGFTEPLKQIIVTVKSKTAGNENKKWFMQVDC